MRLCWELEGSQVCSAEGAGPIENEGTDPGTQVGVSATGPFTAVQQEALTLLNTCGTCSDPGSGV